MHMGNKRTKFVIGGFVILAAIASLGWYAMSQNAVYYYEVAEVMDGGAAENVRVAGTLVNGTVEQGQVGDPLKFKIHDKGDETQVLYVTYTGAVPDTFKDEPDVEVVVEGDYSGSGTFDANFLLAKCPSKYEAAAENGEQAPSDKQ